MFGLSAVVECVVAEVEDQVWHCDDVGYERLDHHVEYCSWEDPIFEGDRACDLSADCLLDNNRGLQVLSGKWQRYQKEYVSRRSAVDFLDHHGLST